MKRPVKLQFITDHTKRRASFRKRKNTFMKAAQELSTLCGVEVSAIVYSPYSREPDVWPDLVGVQNALFEVKRTSQRSRSTKTIFTQETFLEENLDKVKQKLQKQRRENHEMEMTQLMFQFMAGRELTGLELTDFSNLNSLLGRRMNEIGYRLQDLDSRQWELESTAAATGATSATAAAAATAPLDGSVNVGNNDQIPYWSNKYFPN